MAETGNSHAGHETNNPLKDQVLGIMNDTQQVLHGEGSAPKRENSQEADLIHAIEALPAKALAELAVGKHIEKVEDPGAKRVRMSMDLWQDRETDHKVHRLARPAYIKAQNRKINELLKGKKIKATRSDDSRQAAIIGKTAKGNLLHVDEADRRSVSGTFDHAKIEGSGGKIVLVADNLPEDSNVKYWSVTVADLKQGWTADIEIEDPAQETGGNTQ